MIAWSHHTHTVTACARNCTVCHVVWERNIDLVHRMNTNEPTSLSSMSVRSPIWRRVSHLRFLVKCASCVLFGRAWITPFSAARFAVSQLTSCILSSISVKWIRVARNLATLPALSPAAGDNETKQVIGCHFVSAIITSITHFLIHSS